MTKYRVDTVSALHRAGFSTLQVVGVGVAESLEEENQKLSAQVERLREALIYSADYLDQGPINSIGYKSKAHMEMRHALEGTPAQALVEIKTQAFMAGQADCGIDPSYSSAMEYVNRTTNKSGGVDEH